MEKVRGGVLRWEQRDVEDDVNRAEGPARKGSGNYKGWLNRVNMSSCTLGKTASASVRLSMSDRRACGTQSGGYPRDVSKSFMKLTRASTPSDGKAL